MDKIWAPWRKEYITNEKPRDCIFCSKPRSRQDKKNFIIKRTKFSFSMLNIFPYNNGHIMVAPFKHTKDLQDLNDREILDLISLVKQTCAVLSKILKPKGFNIGMNIGKLSGAGFSEHLHIHIVPRWEGDTNFMPVISDTKVISESLSSLYQRFKDVDQRGD
jgi:ATP adenylyltransferase